MKTFQQRKKHRGKRWRFWLIFVATPIMVTVCSSLAVYGLYAKKGFSGKQGIEKGLIYAKLHRNREAIDVFRKELAKSPEDANIYYHMGISYFRLREYDRAIAKLENALKIRPDFSDARHQLTAIYLTKALELRKLGKNESLALEKLLEAEDICRDIIERDPNYKNAYIRLGEIHIAQGFIEDAIIDFEDALKLDNSLINGHVALIKLYMQADKIDLAEKQCNVVLSGIDPDSYEVQIFLSTIYEQQDELSKAAACLKRILEKKPEDVTAHVQLGLLYMKMSKYDDAFAEAEQVYKKSPSSSPPAVYFIKGNVQFQRKEYVNAISSLKEVTKRLPKLAQPHYLLALALTERGQIEEAKREFRTAFDYTPGFVPAQLGLARLLVKDGKHKETIELCKNILEIEPENVDAMQILGMAYMGARDFKNAEKFFGKVLEAKPKVGDINMAHLSLASGQLSKCIRQCEQIIKVSPEEPKAYDILGLAHVRRGDFDKGIVQLQKAIAIAPNSIMIHLNLARTYVISGKDEEAIKTLENLISLDPKNLHASTIRAYLYMKEGDIDEATKTLEKVSEINPDFLPGYELASLYLLQGRADESITLCKRALKLAPEDAMLHANLAVAYQQKENYEASILSCQKAFELNPEIPFLNFLMTNVYTANGVFDKAADYFVKGTVLLQRKDYVSAISSLKEVTRRLPKLAQPHYILALALTESGRIGEAKTEFKTAIDYALGFVPAQLGLARLLVKDGKHMETIELGKNILEIEPENVDAMQILGMAYMGVRDFKNAEELFRKVLEIKPTIGAIDMAHLSLVSGQLSKCIRQCEQIIKVNPEKPEAYNILGLAHVRRGDFNKGIEQLKKGIEIAPNSINTHVNLARAYVLNGQDGEAIKTLENLISFDPNNMHARMILADLHEKGSIDKGLEMIGEVMEPELENLIDHTLLGERNLANAGYEDNEMKLSKMMVRGKFVEEQVESISTFTNDQKKEYLELIDLCQNDNERGKQITLALNKAIVARQGGIFNLAISECKRAAKITPENLIPKMLLASTYLSANQKEEAIKTYNEIINTKPEFASHDLGMAYLMADKQDEAISIYQDLVDMESESVPARLNLARLLIRKGLIDEAVKVVEEATEIDPKSLIAHNILGELSLLNAKYEDAEVEFSKMMQLNNDTFEGHFNMARVKFAQGDFAGCIRHCKRGLKIKPADIRLHNILGMAYMKKGMLNDAVAEFNKIIDINSDYVPAYLNLASIRLSVNQPGIAAVIYKTVLKANPDTIEARLGLGNSYALMGNHTAAIGEFETVKELDPNNVAVCASLARSHMALGKNDKAQEAALKILNLEPKNPIARSLLAKIYVRNEDMPKAIDQLKAVLHDNPKFIDAYGLGILYMDNGEYDNAISTYKQGIENFPNNTLLWCNMAVAYLMKGDYKGANNASLKALNIQPDGAIPNLCKINILLAKGNFRSARFYLRGMVKLSTVQKNNYQDLIEFCSRNKELANKVSNHLSLAIAYSNNRWFKRALREYESITEIIPDSAFAYNAHADILTLAGRGDKAIEIYKKIIELKPESSYVYNKIAAIHNRKGKRDEAEAQYRKAISFDPGNITAHLNLGIIFESKNMVEESVKAYKKVIELEPTSPIAFNNLAWLYISKMQGKLEDALKLAEKARELAPDNAPVIDTLGWIYFLNGMYEEAMSELETAVRNAPLNPTIRYHLGVVYYKKELRSLALAEVENALKISNTFPESKQARELIQKISSSKASEKTISMIDM